MNKSGGKEYKEVISNRTYSYLMSVFFFVLNVSFCLPAKLSSWCSWRFYLQEKKEQLPGETVVKLGNLTQCSLCDL